MKKSSSSISIPGEIDHLYQRNPFVSDEAKEHFDLSQKQGLDGSKPPPIITTTTIAVVATVVKVVKK